MPGNEMPENTKALSRELQQLLVAEIEARGPIPFSRFMEFALYHPEHGYYRRARDPFGMEGDFYTAAQLQPVFGRLIGAVIRPLLEELGSRVVVDLGAGRGEMSEVLGAEFDYKGVDVDRGSLPERFEGVVFANEFFDALPVNVFIARDGWLRERRVSWRDGRFEWVEGGPVQRTDLPDGIIREACPSASAWLERISQSLHKGSLLAIDYGYTERELIRFPQGTLMAYRKHHAHGDVLDSPGSQDITAHVNFTSLQDSAHACGFRTVWFESLSRTLIRAGEAAMQRALEGDEAKHRLQLKSLLFGMGETFRTLLLKKG
jgi:SAM-dependent MidA family methyltransferase